MNTALTIAGFDPCSGAGITADIKTFHAFGIYGMGVITANTVQNTEKVFSVYPCEAQVVLEQVGRLQADIPIDAIKIGMLGTEEMVAAVVKGIKRIEQPPVVLDPVLISSSGHRLLSKEGQGLMISELFPLLSLVTPNLNEASVLVGSAIKTLDEMVTAAKKISQMGVSNVLIKGGHLEGKATDLLYSSGTLTWYKEERILNKDTHGTGCTLSSAIAAGLAKGNPLGQAVALGKTYITRMIKNEVILGKGAGLIDHLDALV